MKKTTIGRGSKLNQAIQSPCKDANTMQNKAARYPYLAQNLNRFMGSQMVENRNTINNTGEA